MCIQDKILLGYLEDIYSIKKEDITTKFLDSIKQININQSINYNELLLFKNLEEIVITNTNIDNSLYNVLSNLNVKKITFLNCTLEDFKYFKNNLEYLSFNNCDIDNINEIGKFNKLDSLYLDEVNNINLDYLPNIRNIKNLSFLNTEVFNEEKLITLDKIENLCISGTNIKNIDTLAENDTLKVLVIDKEIYDENKEVVKYLINKKVNVVDYMNQDVESAYGI